jgi:hypothetical protein
MITGVHQPLAAGRPRSAWAGFAVLAALTAAELAVATSSASARARATALGGLLIAKAGVVLGACLRVSWRRASPRLALAALAIATGFAVVLMLEAVFQVRLG